MTYQPPDPAFLEPGPLFHNPIELLQLKNVICILPSQMSTKLRTNYFPIWNGLWA